MKNLRFFLMSMLVMLGMTTYAQDAVIDFSGNEDVWGIGTTKLTDANSYTYDNLTITLTGTSGGGYRWYDSGNIILGKKDATLELPAFSFDVERIDIVGTSGASAAVKQNIFVGDQAVSTETTGAKDVTNMYMIAEGYQTAGTKYVLKVTSAHNTQITKILIYKKGANVKQQAGLSWGKASVTVTLGEDSYELPQLSNPNNLTVTYESSTPAVATVDANGRVQVLTAGKTDISAVFAGNDTFEAQTAKYQLVVKEAGGGETPTIELITVAKALELINALEGGKTTADAYQVKGYIVGDPDFQRNKDNQLYGNVNFDIADEKGGSTKLTVFRAKSFENQAFTETTTSLLKAGDLVVIQGKLQKYVKNDETTPELTNGYLISVNGQTTFIEAVQAEAVEAPVYNLAGQRVEKAQKGLYIQNGKKFFVK